MTLKSQISIISSQQQTGSSTRTTSHCEVDLYESEQSPNSCHLMEVSLSKSSVEFFEPLKDRWLLKQILLLRAIFLVFWLV